MSIESYADTFFYNLLAAVEANLGRIVGTSFYDYDVSVFVSSNMTPIGCPVLLIDLNENEQPFYSKVSADMGAHGSGGKIIEFDPVPPPSTYLLIVGARQAVESTPYARGGGTGVTTEAGLVDLQNLVRAVTLVDFEGSYPYEDTDKVVETGCTYNKVVTKFRDFYIIDSNALGGQAVTFGHNSNPLFTDGTCPGVACIEVSTAGDVAGIAGFACKAFEGGSNFRVKQGMRFWIEEENTEDDEIQVSIGFTNGKDGFVDGDGSTKFMPGNSVHYNYNVPRHADGSHLVEQILTSDSQGAGPATWTTIPVVSTVKWPKAGRWVSVDMYYDLTPDLGQLTLSGTAPLTIGAGFNYYGPDPVIEIIPMIYVKKKKGNKPMKVYVDYIYYGVEPE